VNLCQKRPTKETCKRDLKKRPTKETYTGSCKSLVCYKRDLQKRPTKETYKRDPQIKEEMKRDILP